MRRRAGTRRWVASGTWGGTAAAETRVEAPGQRTAGLPKREAPSAETTPASGMTAASETTPAPGTTPSYRGTAVRSMLGPAAMRPCPMTAVRATAGLAMAAAAAAARAAVARAAVARAAAARAAGAPAAAALAGACATRSRATAAATGWDCASPARPIRRAARRVLRARTARARIWCATLASVRRRRGATRPRARTRARRSTFRAANRTERAAARFCRPGRATEGVTHVNATIVRSRATCVTVRPTASWRARPRYRRGPQPSARPQLIDRAGPDGNIVTDNRGGRATGSPDPRPSFYNPTVNGLSTSCLSRRVRVSTPRSWPAFGEGRA